MLVRVECNECGATYEEIPEGECPDCGENNLNEIYACVCNECGLEVEGEPGDPCQECEGILG